MAITKVITRDPSIAGYDRWLFQRKGANQSQYGEFCVVSCECMPYTFASDNYWSSTEYSSTNAWNQNFNNGNQNNNNKDNSNYVRAVRL